MSRSELGEFLRVRRGQLSPRQVGLRDSGRRRTPGLRREEVASLAGVSVDYLIRLEQGRESNPSVGVIAALADALLLSQDEHRYLYTLASVAQDVGPCAPTDGPSDRVAAPVQDVLDHLTGLPAYVAGPYGDILAWNAEWGLVAVPLGLVGGPHRGNLPRFVFLDPEAPRVVADWAAAADATVAQLRGARIRWGAEERLEALVQELRRSPEFAHRWDAYPVLEDLRGTLLEDLRGTLGLEHPRLGPLRIAYETLSVADDDQRLVCWLAADSHTATVFADLARTSNRLRV